MRRLALLLALLLLGLARGRAQVQIHEFMASNTRALPDITDFEDYPDWIELKNTGANAASLDGYFLSDDPSDPFKWPIPSTASIPTGGFLVFMADGHDAAPGQIFPRGYWPWKDFTTEKYHTNFSLGAEGETLTLTRATGLSTVALVNASTPAPVPPATVAVWRYKDNGTDQSTQWRARNFDDSGWAAGRSELGYGDAPATPVSYGPSSSNKYITTYFRHHFTVSNPTAYHGLTLKLLVDDGCVIYLNGAEVVRRNMPVGDVNYKTLALSAVGGADESTFFTYTVPASALVAGDNVLAVEVHQSDAGSSDLSFDLGLTASSHTASNLVDSVTFGQQLPDISYGRDAANPGIWKQFAESTPGAENSTAVVNDIRVDGTPITVSLPSGLYAAAQTVTLSAPSGQIRYTLDGSNPKSTSAPYSTPLSIAATTILRARCFDPGKAPGPIETRSYFFGESAAAVPIVSVVADPQTLFGSTIGIYKNLHETVSGSYGEHDVYKGKDAPGNVELFNPDGSLGFTAGCGIRIGGENNWVHPQKALNIAIRGKYGTDEITYDLFPGTQIPIHTGFTLRDGGDNWDKDMLRDCLYPRLTKGFMNVDVAEYRPSIVFINGVYYGLHDLRQRWDDTWFFQQYHVPADKIDHLLYGHVASAATTLGVDKGSDADWLALVDFIRTADLTNAANWAYVESKIDIDSYMDFVIAESYGNNTSWHHNREFWKAKTPGAKWRWFLTDMDRTFFTSSLTGILSDILASNDEVLFYLKTNAGFKQRLAQRYAAHMAGTFAASRVQSVIAAMDAEVSALVPRHVARWAPNGTTVATRASNIQQIKDYATQRAANVHGEISTELGVGTAVNFTLSVSNAAQGSVLVQGVPVSPSTFKMFPNVPFTLQAVPAPGYAFSGWTGASGGSSTSITISGAATVTANFVPVAETILGGTLASNTTLTLASSPYVVRQDLIVPAGVTLTVQAGVEIRMAALRNIRVQGALVVAGNAGQKVRIIGRNGNRWGGISFESPSAPSSLAHLVVRNASRGYDATRYPASITGRNATITADFIDVDESENPFYMITGSTIVRDSTFHNPFTGDGLHIKGGTATLLRCNFPGNNAPDTDGIDFDGVANGVIEGCHIYRFQGSNSDGIDIGEGSTNLVLQGNLIYFNSDKGVSVGQASSVTIRRNLIVGCNLGIGVKDAGSTATLDQNTFVSCNTGLAVYEKNFGDGGGTIIASNTILAKSATAPATVDGFSILSMSYCLSDTAPLAGANNQLADPQFVDPSVLNYQLKPTSPAIDAGDPAHPLDADNTRADIGAEYSYSPGDYPYTIGESVVVNEVLANSGGAADWIELHNRTSSAVNIGGWFLSNNASDLLKYRIPPGTIIPADGYLTFSESANFGAASVDPNKITPFALSNVGDTVYLSSAVNDQLTDYQSKEEFGPTLPGETLGAYYKPSTDSYNFVAMATATPGVANSAPRVGPIVISEIMYNPSGDGDSEYIELLNVSNASVTLYDSLKGKAWRISDGIDFEFPAANPLVMAPGERVIVTKNINLFNTAFGSLVPAGTKVFEWITGSLANSGETLQLDRPGGVDAFNVLQYVRQDRVNYDDDLPWPAAPDGTGPSLTKISESNYGNDYINWTSAPPTPGFANSQTPADSDGDGLPDGYEVANGFNPNDSSDAALDIDGDGASNLAEYLAGTNPHSSASHFTATLVPAATPGQFAIRFTAVAGKSYSIRYKNDLRAPAWTKLGDVPAQATDTLLEVTDPGSGAQPNRFYQIVTPAQP